MKTFKTRHQFYLPDDLSETLDRLARKPGSSKTAILTEAFRHWLDRRGGPDVDKQFGQRLDRLSREHGRIQERIDILAEALGLFIQHQLTIVAHQPPFDAEARALGQERYRAFVELTGRRMAKPDGNLRLAPRRES